MASSGPIYKQIKHYLETIIAQNQGNSQYMLPSENQIALRFHSSRIPAKRALEELAEEGRIYRVQGKGSFISPAGDSAPAGGQSVCLFVSSTRYRFINSIIEGAQQYLNSVGFDLYIVLTNDDSCMEEHMINSALEKQYAGFLIFPGIYHTYNDALLKLALQRFPVVFVGRNLPGLKISSVDSDHYGQAHGAVSYLLERGHREIGFISEPASSSISYEDRIRGYRTAVSENFTQSFLHLAEIDFFSSAGDEHSAELRIAREIDSYFQEHAAITALITSNMALHYIYDYLQCHALPLKTIMVFDEPDRFIGNIEPRPIVIDQQPRTLGYRSAEQLHRQILRQSDVQNITIQYTILEP